MEAPKSLKTCVQALYMLTQSMGAFAFSAATEIPNINEAPPSPPLRFPSFLGGGRAIGDALQKWSMAGIAVLMFLDTIVVGYFATKLNHPFLPLTYF